MTIEINSKYDLKDIAMEFGVSITDLKALIDGTLTNKNGNNGVHVIATTIIEAYIRHLHSLKNRISPLTLKRCDNFLTRFKNFLYNNYESMTIAELNEPILHEFFATCTGRGGNSLTTGTQNNYSAIIRAMLKFAWTEDLVEKDYSHKFKQSKASLLPRYLTSEQLKSLLSASLKKTYGYRCHAIISFMAGTGCRLSEVSNIRICDFDIENNIIFIHKGKGNKDRYIPMFPQVKKVILDYLHLTGIDKWNRSMNGSLFTHDFGLHPRRPIAQRTIQHMCKTLFDKLSYANHTVHSLRHTFAVRCLKVGMPIHNLSLIMGHTNINTTFIYVQLFPQDLKDEVTSKYPLAFEALITQILNWRDVNEGP